MRVRDLRLTLNNIVAHPKGDGSVECYKVALLTKQNSDKVTDYQYFCYGPKGSNFSIKCPANPENQTTFKDVQKALTKEETISLIPENIQIKAYAFLNDQDHLLDGVSVKADSIQMPIEHQGLDFSNKY